MIPFFFKDLRARLGLKLLDDKEGVGYEAMMLHRVCSDCQRTVYQVLRDHKILYHKMPEKEMLSDKEIEEIYDA